MLSGFITIACHKDKNLNADETVLPNTEYPSTANVLRNAVVDIDNNYYDAVQIGNQIWMAENLFTTRYSDGTSIPLGTSASTITSYRYNPNNSANNVPTYGYLYNWSAVMRGGNSSNANPSGVQGVCPDGWHVPSCAEWDQLNYYMKTHSLYLCDENDWTSIAKALSATTGWTDYGFSCSPGHLPSQNNASGFSALPAGDYHGGNYYGFGSYTNFWSATGNHDNYAYSRYLYSNYAIVDRYYYHKYYGFSVRCVFHRALQSYSTNLMNGLPRTVEICAKVRSVKIFSMCALLPAESCISVMMKKFQIIIDINEKKYIFAAL